MGGYLNVEFDEIERESGGFVEGQDGIFLDGSHSSIGRLQNVHAITSVSDHDELWHLEATPTHFHPCKNVTTTINKKTKKLRTKMNEKENIPLGKREEQRAREAFSVTRSREGTSVTWTALRAISVRD